MSGNKMMLLVNPHAGKGGALAALGDVLTVFCNTGWEPTVYMTQKKGDAPRLVREHAANYDLLVCIGGDTEEVELPSSADAMSHPNLIPPYNGT